MLIIFTIIKDSVQYLLYNIYFFHLQLYLFSSYYEANDL